MVLNVVLPWIAAVLILLVVGAACGFIEEHPRRDDPPDAGDEDPFPCCWPRERYHFRLWSLLRTGLPRPPRISSSSGS